MFRCSVEVWCSDTVVCIAGTENMSGVQLCLMLCGCVVDVLLFCCIYFVSTV